MRMEGPFLLLGVGVTGEIFSTNQVMRWLAPVPRLEHYGG
jgi:hypothetical protein